MPQFINLETLKSLRIERGLTQEALALRCGCTKDTVSRWERGRSCNLRPRLREKLSQALGVKWEVLTGPLEKPKEAPDREDLVQISARVRPEVRNALQLLCARFGVDQRMVFEYAPLLFLIAAEQSLKYRLATVDELERDLWSASEAVHQQAPYLGKHFPDPATQEALIEERQAIESRDLFRAGCSFFDDEQHNPFVSFLANQAKALGEGAVRELTPTYAGYAAYEIAVDTLDVIMGEDTATSTPDAERIRSAILGGIIELRAYLSQREALPRPDFDVWVKARLAERTEKYGKFLKELIDAVELRQIEREALVEALSKTADS